MLGYGSHTEAPLTSFDPRNIPGNVPKPLRFLTGCLCFGFFFFFEHERARQDIPIFFLFFTVTLYSFARLFSLAYMLLVATQTRNPIAGFSRPPPKTARALRFYAKRLSPSMLIRLPATRIYIFFLFLLVAL